MQIVENQIVEKIKALSPDELEEVVRYVDELLRKRGQRQTFAEKIREIVSNVPDDVWDRIPTDGSEQHDHYIYGTPKR